MKSIVCKADGSRGGFVTIGLAPANRSQQTRFGALDTIIIVTVLLVTVGLLRFVLGS